MIDSDGKPYLVLLHSEQPYSRTEKFKDAEGNECHREVMVNPEPTDTKNYDLQTAGWFKKVTWREIAYKDIYVPVKNSVGFQKKKAVILSEYVVNIEKMPNDVCAEKNITYCYLRTMPSLVLMRDFKSDYVYAFFLNKQMLKNGVYELTSERELTTKEAKRLIADQNVFCSDGTLKLDLGA